MDRGVWTKRLEIPLDGSNLEVALDERKDKATKVLDEVVKDLESSGILRALHVDQRPNLGSFEKQMLFSQHNLELLLAHTVWFRPGRVVLDKDV